jgi:hypothetical protein
MKAACRAVLILAALSPGSLPLQAQATGCPPGYVQTGVEDEHPSANLVIHHAVCEEVEAKQERSYTPSGNAFIGGTTWITGYNLQSADPKLRVKMQGLMARQMKLAGLRYSEGVDFSRYNFVLGIGASTNQYVDLANRVVFDEYTNGQFSANEQELYVSLKGRQFNELGCHSNGAMICLAALENKDIIAERVVLYGPQITLESLQMWDQLVREGRVKSVEINIDRSDPVPSLSLCIGGGMVKAVSIASLALLKPPTLKDVIEEAAPRLTVRTYNCGNGMPDLDCHDMRAYKRNVEKK